MYCFQRKIVKMSLLLTAILLLNASNGWADESKDIVFVNECKKSQAELTFYILNYGKGHIYTALDADGGKKVFSKAFARFWSKNRYPKLTEESILDHGRAVIKLPNLALAVGDPGKILIIKDVMPGQTVVINESCQDFSIR